MEAGGPGSPNYHKSNALKTMRRRPELQGKLLAKGGWDYQLVDELQPQPGDVVLPKPRYSGFFQHSAGQYFAQPRHSPPDLYRHRHQCLRGVHPARRLLPRVFRRRAGRRHPPAGPAFAQQAALFNIETFFGWVSDVASFCDALAPAAPLSFPEEKRYA